MDVFHVGETTLQKQFGTEESLQGTMIGPEISVTQKIFLNSLPLILIGGLDAQNRVWASLLSGVPGFIHTLDPKRLLIHAQLLTGDPLTNHLPEGAPLGMLALQAQYRRRYRINGLVTHYNEDGLALKVQQSYGNCPRYIHPRQVNFEAEATPTVEPVQGVELDEFARDFIQNADTFFIASAHPLAGTSAADPNQGVDVSHKAGQPGFVELVGDNLLLIEDYPGNNYFNTLGNLYLNPKAGLLFIDYASASVLWLTAKTEILVDGYRRFIRLTVQEFAYAKNALPLHWNSP
ncbi:MAG TPA: pyridoxamine 5'-phosphate oxidase family protein [Thiolinea sp.]|nr:pyridoxamine 5'-phosphate oxidase family protein [Thiolinea sp.]